VTHFSQGRASAGKHFLFTGSSPQWLFSVPEDIGNIEKKAFWWHWWHQE
jgi:hypothetical protein